MRPELLQFLVCPGCGGELDHHPFRGSLPGVDEVEEGLLVCRSCAQPYPITGGIPRMLPNAFLRQGGFRAEFGTQLRKLAFQDADQAAVRHFEKLHRLTARAFAYEWNTYQTTSREEDILTFFWLTGADPAIYRRFSFEDVFSYYPTEAEISGIDPLRLQGSVLEVGCGMGKYVKVVSDHARQVIGLDLSDALLRARKETGGRANVHLVQGNILSSPIRPQSIDFVYSVGVLHHTPDTHQAFLRSASLVKPGGALAVWLYPRDLTSGRYAERVHWLQDDVLRPITCRLPPRLLRGFAAILGRLTFVRDRHAERFRATGSKYHYYVAMTAGALAVGRHKDPEIAAFLNFDWYSPHYRSYHTEDEVAGWYGEAGFQPATVLPQRVSAIATR